jgi:cytochrome c biogenesis protein CcmG/thiol:disulfide interchange protein DsbE
VSRTRLAWLVLLIGSFGGALTYAVTGQDEPPAATVDLQPFRAAAALDPCPAGLSLDLPDVTLPCLGGGPDVPLRGVPRGRPSLVNVYGSWCGPCQEEMPLLVDFSKRAGDKVALVGVDTVDEPRSALQFAKDFGQHWPAVVDDDKVVLRNYASGPPVTLFVDASGRVRFVKTGPFRSAAELDALVRQHLGVTV